MVDVDLYPQRPYLYPREARLVQIFARLSALGEFLLHPSAEISASPSRTESMDGTTVSISELLIGADEVLWCPGMKACEGLPSPIRLSPSSFTDGPSAFPADLAVSGYSLLDLCGVLS